MAFFEAAFGDVFELFAPMWVEILFMVFFAVGFAVVPRTQRSAKAAKADGGKSNLLHKQIEADVEAGHNAAALKAWRVARSLAPTPLETLKSVVQVLLDMQPSTLVEEVIEHFQAHRQVLGNARGANAILDAVARAGHVVLLDELANDFKCKLHISPTVHTYEILLGGHASVGDERKVAELCAEMESRRQVLTARCYSLAIKGFLKNGLVDAALCQIQNMHKKGFFVPSFALAQLFRTASQDGRCEEIFDRVRDSLQIPPDAATAALEDCCKNNNLALALRIESFLRESGSVLQVAAYDHLLKVSVAHADVHALQLFQSMQREGVRISEGLCVGLLARCADSKFLRFAEEIVGYMRSNSGMTIASYSALMKVYAYCGMYDKACDLYEQIRAEGLEPDSVMYGCLMKFSVECGRTELSRECFDKSPTVDIQNYMSLIRAAGRDKDADRAFAVLEKLKASSASIDIAAYNCVLDACASAGDMKRARILVAEMKSFKSLDIITYNTLLKGYCAKGDINGAKDIFHEIRQAGLLPNDVSYNCLINAAVSSGNFREAWRTVDMMEKSNVPVDHYTISIMMKALKKAKDSKDVSRALELLDRSGVNACSDDVLLNNVVEACTRHRKLHRLECIVESFLSSNLRPSVHTYGTIIKACSALKRMDKCNQLWGMMIDKGIEPNDIVLGCMLDAFVCNGKVEDAVKLLKQWSSKIVPNTVMYSTILKGFANSRQPGRALDIWKDMHASGLPLNTVVYNVMIDSQARVGAMDEVSKLVGSMGPNGCSPDGITYSTIVKGYCVKGALDKAFEVFRDMQKSGLAHDAIVYNTTSVIKCS
jgi:pentatricopeptide repeat protein